MRYRVAVRIAVTLAALVVAGCGDSGSTSAPASSSSTTSSAVRSSGGASSASAAPPSASPAPSAPAAGTSAAAVPPAQQPPVLAPPSNTAPAPAPPADKGAAYLSALTAGGVPTSTSGATEIQIAQRVCGELAKGTPRTKLVDDIALLGGLVTEDQADLMVTAAEQHYC